MSYDRWAAFYDAYPNPTVAIDELTFPALWAHLKGKQVLELGCGTGRHTTKLASAGNEVVGLDVSSGMLDVARGKLAGTRATLIEADFMTYDEILKHGFDVVLESLVLEHVFDLEAFFKRAARALKPGGELYLSEIHPTRAKAGSLAHFKDPATGEEVQLESYAHTAATMEASGRSAGFLLVQKHDVLGSEALAQAHAPWSKYLKMSMLQHWVWRLPPTHLDFSS
jgi:malonyl-CoA O-methyltransferase